MGDDSPEREDKTIVLGLVALIDLVTCRRRDFDFVVFSLVVSLVGALDFGAGGWCLVMALTGEVGSFFFAGTVHSACESEDEDKIKKGLVGALTGEVGSFFFAGTVHSACESEDEDKIKKGLVRALTGEVGSFVGTVHSACESESEEEITQCLVGALTREVDGDVDWNKAFLVETVLDSEPDCESEERKMK